MANILINIKVRTIIRILISKVRIKTYINEILIHSQSSVITYIVTSCKPYYFYYPTSNITMKQTIKSTKG